MPHHQAALFKVLFVWLFITTMGLRVSGKTLAAVFYVDWRSTNEPSGAAVVTVLQESACGKKDDDNNFHAVFRTTTPKWSMQMTHAEDAPYTDHEGRCRAKSKVTLAISRADVSIRIRLNNLCSDEACALNNLSGSFSCGVVKAPENTEQHFTISGGREIKCSR